MGFYGNAMAVPRQCPGVVVEAHGVSWTFMDFPELLWAFMALPWGFVAPAAMATP